MASSDNPRRQGGSTPRYDPPTRDPILPERSIYPPRDRDDDGDKHSHLPGIPTIDPPPPPPAREEDQG
jgi:hypothetical protein